jgi:hypothetical protein
LKAFVRGTALLLGALAGCNQLLGIDESFVDPALEPRARGEGGEPTVGAQAGSPTRPSGGSLGSAGEPSAGGAAGASAAEVPAGGVSGAAGAPAGADVCEQYCDLMGEHCAGDALQYRDNAQCLKICRLFPVGVLDDDRVNTAACRRRYAGKARYLAGPELVTNCGYAGPGGDGRCGSNCEGFCTIALAACSPELSEPYFYRSFDDCLLDCEDLPSSRYQYGATSAGNSLECRLFHASSAVMADADEHCEHTLGIALCTE